MMPTSRLNIGELIVCYNNYRLVALRDSGSEKTEPWSVLVNNKLLIAQQVSTFDVLIRINRIIAHQLMFVSLY